MRIIDGIEELKSLTGEELGVSDWVTIDQDRIQAFADATGDHQWIHVDVERAERESPWGAPVAHGYLTLSLLPKLTEQIYKVEGPTAKINYGLNRVRFPNAVKSGSRVRGRTRLINLEQIAPNQHRGTFETIIEVEGADKPACIAEGLVVYVLD
ncbi:MaoC family dehydratase [Ectothiorhodospiraceae bacterium WFHF3C12]|nr:MaoC family dehydratase [Ectothiorhodospiraceae bacterium WFHF3C12]